MATARFAPLLINFAAIERNVQRLLSNARPGTQPCAVVKADRYGHGAVAVAQAAQAAGRRLAVATAAEAATLRASRVRGPLLVLGALTSDDLALALDVGADVTSSTSSCSIESTSW